MAIQRIENKNISDAVLEEIKRLIGSGEWGPGSKIPSENELAATMGVSRVSVRSALQRLSSLGLIESRQGGGTFVCEMDGGQYMNMLFPTAVLTGSQRQYLLEFRQVIESEQAYYAARRATEQDLALLKGNYEEMQGLDPASEECYDADVEFHMLLANASKNPLFIQTSHILREAIFENIKEDRAVSGENPTMEDHRRIIQAVEAHDPKAAKQAMWEHLDKIWNWVKKQ